MDFPGSVISTVHLAVGYKEKHRPENILLDEIYFSVAPGDFVCLIGPNGCGKSTLLRTLAGIQKPLKGEIYISGRKLCDLERQELAREVSVVLTENFGIGGASVYSIVSMGRYPHNNWLGTLSAEDKKIINDVLNVTGLSEFAGRNMLELSDGTRQKVMIARALVQDTPLILLDEPTAFLDAPSKLEIMHMLRSLAKQFDKSIVLSSHDLDLALQSADKIMLVTNDQKLEIDTPEDLVLNGSFEAVFNKEDVKFSVQQGIFKMNASREISFEVIGGKAETFWTERALERIGISSHSESRSDGVINIVNLRGKLEWKLEFNDHSEIFLSIGDLLRYLKNSTGKLRKSVE